MAKIKIAYFIDRIIEGGTELQLVEQINRLEGNGAKQILFCLYKSNEHDNIQTNCRTEILNIFSLAKCDTLSKVQKVVKILKKERIDIVQTYFFDSTIFGVLCGKIAKTRVVISCRRDLGFWYTNNLLFWLRIANRFADRILVNSEAVKENVNQVEKVNISKIYVINNGIDIDEYNFDKYEKERCRAKLGVSDDEVCIAIVANMSRRVKRVDLFIEAARILLSRGIKAKFYILGDGYLRNDLENMMRGYHIENFIRFLGRGYNKQMLLAALDIGVITSDSEGFSNSIMEYMASNTAPVASDVDGNRELIQNRVNGYLFKAGDAMDLANKLDTLSKNVEERSKIAAKAREYIVKYEWAIRKEEILQYYHLLFHYRTLF